MPKFRRKSIVLDAERFDRAMVLWPAGVVWMSGEQIGLATKGRVPAVFTSEGWREVADGDWVVTQGDGKKLVVKAAEFAASYEAVSEGGE